MAAVFVAGTGTEVGKTYVACAIVKALRARGLAVDALKPIVSGFDENDWQTSDPGRLLDALGRPLTTESLTAISPWRFKAPLSPDLAARMEGREIDFDAVVGACLSSTALVGHGTVVIEGAGGVMSPIGETATNLDLIVALGAPLVLAAGSNLGTISHTLTAIGAIEARGLGVLAVVVNETHAGPEALGEAVASIRRFAPDHLVVGLPRTSAAVDVMGAVVDFSVA